MCTIHRTEQLNVAIILTSLHCSMHLMNSCRAHYGTEAKLRERQERNRQLLYMNVPSQVGESMHLGKAFEPRRCPVLSRMITVALDPTG